ncbi:MAG: MerR family transcriptional regulator [Jatrophihabitans sp.]
MQAGIPIAEVARRLGVPMPTLRSWELRYGIPESTRSPGQHRRYTAAELQALALMRDEIARGKRASAAAQSVRELLGLSGPAAAHIKAFLAASARLDPAGVRGQLDEAQRQLGLGNCIDDVLLPAMRQIGLWWQNGRCDIEQERLTTETVRGWLDALTAFAPTPTHRRPLVLACGPSDLHTLGLEALGLLLRNQHWACRQLGARVTLPALSTAVSASGAAGVVIVAHLPTGRNRAVQALQLVEDSQTPVFYAGNAFGSARSRRGVPGRYLGQRLQVACRAIDDALSVR